jgi:hypothetical protein
MRWLRWFNFYKRGYDSGYADGRHMGRSEQEAKMRLGGELNPHRAFQAGEDLGFEKGREWERKHPSD